MLSRSFTSIAGLEQNGRISDMTSSDPTSVPLKCFPF